MPEQSYRAFISYSHRDDAAARALHKRLETYRLPKHLIGSETPRGLVPPRLTPIFRDLDELSAADDLSAEIKAALARSEVLIILASPAARASKWVNLEIESFRALHGGARPVLVALIEGEPEDAFPPALTADGHDPVAADFRKNAPGGKRLALLKLVAGITAAPLDALVQRDAQRQYRRVMAITGSALAAVLVMALLLVVALRSQAEAQRQRQEAEGLVEYMLTDLRDRLKGVGRLDVMTAVNERAMKYYGGDSVKAQLLQARTLHALGEDDEKRGDTELAKQKFDKARKITHKYLKLDPRNPDFIFAHAQSEYWFGYLKYRQEDYKSAYFYFNLRKNIVISNFSDHKYDPRWIKEVGYAYGDLCAIHVTVKEISTVNEKNCLSAYNYIKIISDKYLENKIFKIDLINRLNWLSDYYLLAQNNAEFFRLRQISLKLLKELNFKYSSDLDVKERLAGQYVSMALAYKKINDRPNMKVFFFRAIDVYQKILIFDPKNSYAEIWISYIKKEVY